MTRFDPARRRLLAVGAGAATLVAMPSILRAGSYATQPITIVVANPAGGVNDLLARLLQPALQAGLGQPVVVENRAGAAGNIGLAYARAAKPDGHTLFCSGASMMATAHTNRNSQGSAVDMFEHITMLTDGAYTFTIPAALGPRNYQEFRDLVRANASTYKHSTPGAGGSAHLQTELLKANEGLDMPAIHYKGAADTMTDLLTNQIQLANNSILVTAPHLRSGKLVAVFTAGSQRETVVEGIPTSVELGISGVDQISSWYGMHAPKGTPGNILDQIHAATLKGIASPDFAEKASSAGMRAIGDSRASFTARMQADDALFAAIAKSTGIRVG